MTVTEKINQFIAENGGCERDALNVALARMELAQAELAAIKADLIKPFQLPSDKQMIEIAILFNEGKVERQKLADMVGYGQFIVDRLYENGDVGKPSSKEK